MRGDAGGLEASLRAAIITPIERYTRRFCLSFNPLPSLRRNVLHPRSSCFDTAPSMTREVVRLRHKALLETDWLEEAKLAVDEIYTSKGEKVCLAAAANAP